MSNVKSWKMYSVAALMVSMSMAGCMDDAGPSLSDEETEAIVVSANDVDEVHAIPGCQHSAYIYKEGSTIHAQGAITCNRGHNLRYINVMIQKNGENVKLAQQRCWTNHCYVRATYNDSSGNQRWCAVSKAVDVNYLESFKTDCQTL